MPNLKVKRQMNGHMQGMKSLWYLVRTFLPRWKDLFVLEQEIGKHEFTVPLLYRAGAQLLCNEHHRAAEKLLEV